MAADIEKFYAYRKDPGADGADKIGTYKYTDPVTGDVIHGEQVAQYGHPAKFVKIVDDDDGTGPTVDHPAKGGVGITTSAVSTIVFDGPFGFSSDVSGLLVWIEADAADSGNSITNEVRKLTGEPTANNYNVNRNWAEAPASADTYRLLIDTFRYNSMMIKAEFTTSQANCDVVTHFFSVNQDNDLPTPGVATPHRYSTRAYRIQGTNVSTDTTDTSSTHYHGEILSMGVQGALGACVRVTAVSAGTVSLWVALV